MENFYEKLKNIVSDGGIFKDEPMSKHTSLRIGGPADILIIPRSRKELIDVINIIRSNNMPYLIIGNGTNLLVLDKGIRGVVIKLTALKNIMVDDIIIISETGALLSAIANAALSHGLAGFEFASGIPGTIGGAIAMNAGAYGTEIKDVITKVEVIDSNGDIHILENGKMAFSYRNSIIQNDNLIAVRAWLRLHKEEYDVIKKRMNELNNMRKEKQPLEYPSAGSIFKRPHGNYAGKLIQDAGLRGYSIGDAQVSEKHCGFIINKGNATAEDVLNLIKYIQNKVKEKFGVQLVPEVKIVGEQ
ncbi:MAG: UDP-N-acetylmuramate dehydrogenase [Thermoanaerobacteraceae bacterium]|nr:UDP-N-acetylmuramate dehydrogenase [Thermoanaerobacteraceae bacterium]